MLRRRREDVPSTALVQPQHKRREGEPNQPQRTRVSELLVRRERDLRDRVVARRAARARSPFFGESRVLLDYMVVPQVVGVGAAAAAIDGLVAAWWVLGAEGGDGLDWGFVGHCSG